jgi:hypothetical protein
VSIVWADAAHRRVHLRVFVVDQAQRYDYDLAFAAGDEPAERGRAIGLALTPVLARALVPAPAAAASATGSMSTPLGSDPSRPLDRAPGSTSTESTAQSVARPPFAIDIAASGSVGIGGNALGVGPSIGLRRDIIESIAAHATATARFGPESPADAASFDVAVGGGVAVRIARIGRGRPIEVGARADLLAKELTVVQSLGGGSIRRSRWLTAADLVLEGAWPLTGSIDVAAAAGAEITAGSTAVTVGGTTVDHIPVGRGIAELGVRYRF